MRNMSSSRRAGAKLAASLSSSPCTPRTCRITQRAQCLLTAPRRHQVSAAAKLPSNAAANADKVQHDLSPSDESEPLRSLTDGLQDPPPVLNEDERQVDWTRSYHGLSATPFTAEQAAILQEPIDLGDIEIKPDGIVYLPEIKYRRKLNKAFGPGGWGLAPRGETIVTDKIVTREYGLVCGGRLVSIARGEQQYFDPDGIPTATEGCKSNALMRCCKDLGIASELWDPRFIRKFMSEMAKEMLVEHATTKKRRKHFMRKDDELKYPWKEISAFNDANKTNVAAAYKTARPPGTPATASGVTSAAAQAFQNAKTKVQTPSLPVKAAPVKK